MKQWFLNETTATSSGT